MHMVYGICIMKISDMEQFFHYMLPVPNKIKVRKFLPGTVYFSNNSNK